MLRKAAGILLLLLSGILLAVSLRQFPHDPRRALALAAPALAASVLNLFLIGNRPWRPAMLPRISAVAICLIAAGALLYMMWNTKANILPDVPRSDVEMREKLVKSIENLPFVAAGMLVAGASVMILPRGSARRENSTPGEQANAKSGN